MADSTAFGDGGGAIGQNIYVAKNDRKGVKDDGIECTFGSPRVRKVVEFGY